MKRTKESCPVAALAREARRLEDEVCAANKVRDADQAAGLMEKLDAIRDAITYLQPISNEGAL